jgi:hypothetical protein
MLMTVATGGVAIRSLRRWLVLRRLPVVSCTSFTAAEPGTAVILTGRTANGPLLAASRSGRECVHHLTIYVHEYHYSGEGSTVTERIGPGEGDSRLHGEPGIEVDIDVEVGRRNLFVGAPALLINVPLDRPRFTDRPGDEYYERELITPAGRQVFAAGTVSPGRERLEPYYTVTGSAVGDVSDLGRRFRTEIAWLVPSALALTGAFILMLPNLVR